MSFFDSAFFDSAFFDAATPLVLTTPLAIEASGALVLTAPLAIEASGTLRLSSPLAIEAAGEPDMALDDVFTILEPIDSPFNDFFTVFQGALVGVGLVPLDDSFTVLYGLPSLTDTFVIYKQLIKDRFLLPSGTPRARGKQSGVDLPISIIEVDSTTQLVADQFEAEVLSANFYRNKEKDDTSDLLIGIEASDGSPELVSIVQGGSIDEYELTATPEKLTGRVRGRDAAAYAVDTTFNITFVSAPDPLTLEQSRARAQAIIDAERKQFPLIPIIPGVTVPERRVGWWRASSIAANLAARVGLHLSWEAPDYVLREDFQCSGSVASAIWQLVAPFNYFEPRKIDVWVDGKTLVVRERAGLSESPRPGAPATSSLTTLDAKDPCIISLMVRAHFLSYIRAIRLVGAVGAVGIDPSSLDFSGLIPPEIKLFHTDNRLPNGEGTVEDKMIRNVDGALFSSETSVFGYPPNVGPDQQAGTQASVVELARTRTVNTWAPSFIVEDLDGNVISTIIQTSSDTVSKELVDGVLTPSRHDHTDYFYDEQNYLSGQVDTVEELGTDAKTGVQKLVPTHKKIRTLRDTSNGHWEEVIDTFDAVLDDAGGNTGSAPAEGQAPVPGTPVTSTPGKWVLVDHRTNSGGGHRPGGPGRPGGRNVNSQVPVSYGVLIDDLPGAKDVSIQNRNLTLQHLRYIVGQAKDASGAWEYEINLTAANMPWLKKGDMIHITGWDDEAGEDIPLQPAMIFDIRTTFDQSSADAKTVMAIKALWWSKS